MQDSRLYSLDFLKFVAALMITNSHFQPLYEDVSPSLATFGVHGNALFFFVSGFLLMMGFERKKAFCSMIVGKIMSWIAALTLEIYIVQFSFVTNQFNSLFPLNLLLVFAIIVLAAYLLKVMTSLFLAVLSKEDLEWKEIVRL